MHSHLVTLVVFSALVSVVFAVLLAFARPGTGRRQWLLRSVLFGVGFGITISPWLMRNTLVTGSPTDTDLRYHLVSTYDPDRTAYQYFHGLAPAQAPLDYILDHPGVAVRHVGWGIRTLARKAPNTIAGNPVLLVFALGGLAALWRAAAGSRAR